MARKTIAGLEQQMAELERQRDEQLQEMERENERLRKQAEEYRKQAEREEAAKAEPTVAVSMRLPESLRNRIKEEASKQGVKLQDFYKTAFEFYLDQSGE